MRPWAYSIELRERAVAAWENGNMTETEIAALFKVGEASLRRWKRLKRKTGSVAPQEHAGGPEFRVGDAHEAIVRQLVDDQSDAFLEDLAREFVQRTGRACSSSSMDRALRRLGLTRKKSR
jgi:transposase